MSTALDLNQALMHVRLALASYDEGGRDVRRHLGKAISVLETTLEQYTPVRPTVLDAVKAHESSSNFTAVARIFDDLKKDLAK